MTGGRAGNAMQADFATGKEKTGRGLRWGTETIVAAILTHTTYFESSPNWVAGEELVVRRNTGELNHTELHK